MDVYVPTVAHVIVFTNQKYIFLKLVEEFNPLSRTKAKHLHIIRPSAYRRM